MNKTPVFIDEIVDVRRLKPDEEKPKGDKMKVDFIDITTMVMVVMAFVYIIGQVIFPWMRRQVC